MTALRPAARRRHFLLLAAALLLAGGLTVLTFGPFRADVSPEPAAGPVPGRESPSPTPEASAPPPASRGEVDGDRGADRASSDSPDPGAGEPELPVASHRDAGGSEGSRGFSGGEAPAAGERSAGTPEQALDPSEASAILARAERVYGRLSSLRARFRQTIEVPLMNRRREGHGIWYQAGRDRFRMDFVNPPEDEIVADGMFLWLYYPSTNPKQVIRSTLGEGAASAGTADVLARILEEARVAYESRYAGRESVSGVETDRIELRPLDRGSPYTLVRVWVGRADALVRRFEITEANETVRTVTLSELEPDAPIPGETFRFTPPPDADVFER